MKITQKYRNYWQRRVQKFAGNRYNRLLIVVGFLLLGRPIFSTASVAILLLAWISFLLVVIILDTSSLPSRWLIIYITLAILALFTQLVVFLPVVTPGDLSRSLLTIGLLINSGFFAFSVFSITKNIFREKYVTSDTLKGGISVYIMLRHPRCKRLHIRDAR
jgi:hypothetical protein